MATTHGAFRTRFLNTLNRSDCTTTDADGFTDDAYQRINRVLDHSVREATYSVTPTSDFSSITLPIDCGKRIVEVSINGIPIEARPDRTRLMTDLTSYTRRPGLLVLNQTLAASTPVEVIYWRNFSRPSLDTGTNDLLDNMGDLVLYAALTSAGIYYDHGKAGDWAAAFDRLLQEANAEWYDREMTFLGGPAVIQTPLGAYADY